jgi:hypothetical protein
MLVETPAHRAGPSISTQSQTVGVFGSFLRIPSVRAAEQSPAKYLCAKRFQREKCGPDDLD